MFLCIFLILSCASLFMLPTKLQLKGGPLLIIVFTSSSSNRIFECRWYLICILSVIVTVMLRCLLPNSVACNVQDLRSQVWCHIGQVFHVPHPEVPLERLWSSQICSPTVSETLRSQEQWKHACFLRSILKADITSLFFFKKISNWKIIALQYCVDFCHT